MTIFQELCRPAPPGPVALCGGRGDGRGGERRVQQHEEPRAPRPVRQRGDQRHRHPRPQARHLHPGHQGGPGREDPAGFSVRELFLRRNE